MHSLLQNRYYNIGEENIEKKYLVQTWSQAKSSGIKLPEIHGIGKGLCYGWLSYVEFYMAPQAIFTCKIPSDKPNDITGHVDLLLFGKMSMHEI